MSYLYLLAIPPTMMYVPIDNRDPLEAKDVQSVSGGHSDVVHEAEAHRLRPLGMVSGGPH